MYLVTPIIDDCKTFASYVFSSKPAPDSPEVNQYKILKHQAQLIAIKTIGLFAIGGILAYNYKKIVSNRLLIGSTICILGYNAIRIASNASNLQKNLQKSDNFDSQTPKFDLPPNQYILEQPHILKQPLPQTNASGHSKLYHFPPSIDPTNTFNPDSAQHSSVSGQWQHTTPSQHSTTLHEGPPEWTSTQTEFQHHFEAPQNLKPTLAKEQIIDQLAQGTFFPIIMKVFIEKAYSFLSPIQQTFKVIPTPLDQKR